MEKTLLNEFEKYKEIRNGEFEIRDCEHLSTTVATLLICNDGLKLENIKTIRKIEPEKVTSFENELLNELEIPKNNKNVINFIVHELRNNIYEHSKFSRGLVMGRAYTNFTDVSFIDNGINIANSLKNANYSFKNDCDAILKAINGLSTKNELGFVERGTGLNNTINIVANGCDGSVLIASGKGLVFITPDDIYLKNIDETPVNGTLISLRMNLSEKVDIYKYLNPIKL